MGSGDYYYGPSAPPTTIYPWRNRHLPITNSIKAWKTVGKTFLAAGLLDLEFPILKTEAIGLTGFSFSLNYLNLPPLNSKSDDVAGKGFLYSQQSVLVDSGNGITLKTNEHTSEEFEDVGGGKFSSARNNTAATLWRENKGTADETFTIISRAGSKSVFYGLHHSIIAPGRLKSLTDRWGREQKHAWELLGDKPRLQSVTDGYGRVSNFSYYGSSQDYCLMQVQDFWNRLVNFQYDSEGRLIAVVGPSVTRGANGSANLYPNGTAIGFKYDVENPRPERRNDLIKIWYPNQTAPFLSSRTVDTAGLYSSSTAPRVQISYYSDPTDSFHYGKIQQVTESSSGGASVGAGAYGFIYLNGNLPENKIDHGDPIVSRTIMTDRNGNQVIYDFNMSQMLVHRHAFATRSKNSLQAHSWASWTKYNNHNQPLSVVLPEANSIQYEYEDQSNTIQVNGVPYAPRIGLLKSLKRKVGNNIGLPSRSGSNGQTELSRLYFYDPIFNEQCACVEEPGNPIDAHGEFFPPQNGGTPPTKPDRSRYTTVSYLDFQKDSVSTVAGDTGLLSQLKLAATDIGNLVTYVSGQMTTCLPFGFQMPLGDINGDGTGNGTGNDSKHQGSVVMTILPQVLQLVNSSGATPWVWQTQSRIELYTVNAAGQNTTYTNPEGNLTIYLRFPENNPDGNFDVYDSSLSTKQYGRVKQIIVDANSSHSNVMTLVGASGDMVNFISPRPGVPRTNTPGTFQALASEFTYDPPGYVLSTTDPRGNQTFTNRNELGEVYNVTAPTPYSFQTETYYDANRNVTRVDVQDMVVLYTSTDIHSPNYALFTPTGSGSTANLPMTLGAGGATRTNWFTNQYQYDLLDNKTQDSIDATGSSPSALITNYNYDYNQNLIEAIKPLGNTVNYDYDERDLRIAQRIGSGTEAAVTVWAYDGNENLIDVVGPAVRGTMAQTQSVVINDAFNSSVHRTYVGDWVANNTYDGFDRRIKTIDAVGGSAQSLYDPRNLLVDSTASGTAGGLTPVDHNGSNNVLLSHSIIRFDEAGRQYETQHVVFLNTGLSAGVPTHNLQSGRTVAYSGGGLEANSTTNGHTGATTLTSGGTSYALSRQVFDRSGRLIASATDNAQVTTQTFDGADRRLVATDPVGNVLTNTYDANGNLTGTTSIEVCTIPGVTTTESFGSLMMYDVMNRLVVKADQGADGSLTNSYTTASNTLFAFAGFDSRSNATNTIDPKKNTTVSSYDGAGRHTRTDEHLRTNGYGPGTINVTITTKQVYDANSRLHNLIDSNSGTTQYAYDSLDRQKTMTFSDGSTRQYQYDRASDVTQFTDENGSVNASSFDPLGRRVSASISRATGVIGTTSQSFEFDGVGRSTAATDNGDGTHISDAEFAYHSLGSVVEEKQTYAGDSRYITENNWLGIFKEVITYPNNRRIKSQSDEIYRVTFSEYADLKPVATWTYFGHRLATLNYHNGIVCSYMNNAENRSAIQYGQSTPPWGSISTDHLGYDGAGRLIGKRHINSSGTTLFGFTSSYDMGSNKLFERPLHVENRASLYSGYDSANRLLGYLRGFLAPSGGSVTSPTTLPGAATQTGYTLDKLGNWSQFQYTPVGGSATTQTRAHNYVNQVTGLTISGVTTPIQYDHGNNPSGSPQGNGNITDDGLRTFSYDALNRVVQVNRKSDNAMVAQYAYDALNRRILKTVSNGGLDGFITNGTTRYLHDGQQCIEELSGTSSPTTTRQFVWGQYVDELLRMQTYVTINGLPAGRYYLHSDLLYRSAVLTDETGAIQEAYDTDAYGNTIIFTAPGSGGWFDNTSTQGDQPTCEYIFTGRQYDPETQLYFYRRRYYNPQLGRFISRDPICYRLGGHDEQRANYDRYGSVNTLPARSDQGESRWAGQVSGLNLYEMVNSNPTNQVDPFGLDSWYQGWGSGLWVLFGGYGSDAASESWSPTTGALKEAGGRIADGSNDIVYVVSFTHLGSSNLKMSSLTRYQMSNQGTFWHAQRASTPLWGSGYAAFTGKDPLLEQPIHGADRIAAWSGFISDASMVSAAGFKMAGYNPVIGGGSLTVVSRWGRPGLQAGDWVMRGPASRWNYFFSGKWQPGMTNKFAPFISGNEFEVAGSSLQVPRNPLGPFQYMIGQRQYFPGTVPPSPLQPLILPNLTQPQTQPQAKHQ